VAIEGVDYSWARPDPVCLSKNGKRFAVRYVSWDRTGKNINMAEADRLIAAGLSIVTNWEFAATDQLKGRTRGQNDATEADRLHRLAGGTPGRPIYFSADFDASEAQLVECLKYLTGCADTIGWNRVGVYGGYRTIAFMRDAGVRWLWQTFAWSEGRWHSAANIQQYRNGVTMCGGDIDLNRAMTADYGQWTDGGIMALTDADVRRIWRDGDLISVPDLTTIGATRTAESKEKEPEWAPGTYFREVYENVARTRKDVRALAAPDPVAFAQALASDEHALDALATAVAARVGMIPTAQQIARQVIDQLRDRITLTSAQNGGG
jgi:hypothetical protein